MLLHIVAYVWIILHVICFFKNTFIFDITTTCESIIILYTNHNDALNYCLYVCLFIPEFVDKHWKVYLIFTLKLMLYNHILPINKALTFSAWGKTFAPNVRHCSDIIQLSPRTNSQRERFTLIWIKLLEQRASNAQYNVLSQA